MIAALGTACCLLALGGAVGLVWAGWAAAREPSHADAGRLRWSVAALLAGALGAFAALEVAILRDDFSVIFVAEHSARATPLLYKVATAWSALEGSIVLWGLLLAALTAAVWWGSTRLDDDRLGAGALAVCGGVAVFFFALLATVANPFRAVAGAVPLDGPGPNPLLQNHPLMAIHPPLLYLGFVGFTAPFAFAVSALALGARGTAWVRRTQRWALGAWAFLSAGIVCGAWWSYEVLGWGGYWAWDPVENASFLPWLAGTAYLHSATIQARRGLLQAWSIGLVLATFALTIFGTFLTRSGVIASVHAFSQSAIGPLLLAFLGVVVLGSFGLFAARAHLVAAPNRLDSLVSREGAFLVNNLLLSLFAVTVLVGTTYPLIIEAASGDQLSVGRPFFDRFAIPIALVLLLAVGLGPLLPYRASRPGLLWERARVPAVAALAAAATTVLLVPGAPYVAVTVGLATLVASAFVQQLVVAVGRRRRAAPDEGRLTATGRVVAGEPAFWTGQLAHLGLVVVALGIAVSGNLGDRAAVTLRPGETAAFGGYEVGYVAPFEAQEPNRAVRGAEVALLREGEHLAVLRPRVATFANVAQPVGTPAVWTSRTGDEVYVSLASIDDQAIVLNLYRFPLVSLLWGGGLLLAGAGVGGLVLRWAAARHPAEAVELVPAAGAGRRVPRLVVPGLALALAAVVVVGAIAGGTDRPDRAQSLAAELRCPVCQGESVADSPSSTAEEMRALIAQQVADGRTDAQIRAFFTSRYGDWILLDPPVDGRTLPLWLTPAVVLAGGGIAIARRAGGRRLRAERQLTETDRLAVDAALAEAGR